MTSSVGSREGTAASAAPLSGESSTIMTRSPYMWTTWRFTAAPLGPAAASARPPTRTNSFARSPIPPAMFVSFLGTPLPQSCRYDEAPSFPRLLPPWLLRLQGHLRGSWPPRRGTSTHHPQPNRALRLLLLLP